MPQAAGAEPPTPTTVAALPDAPPADRVSSARQKSAPNWALKTAMAATGTLLAVILVIGALISGWFFGSIIRAHSLARRGDPRWVDYANRVNNGANPWLIALAVIALALVVAHIVIAIVLVRRSMASRGAIPARLHGGLRAWWARSMPFTGAIIAVCLIVFLIWPVTLETAADLSGCADTAGACPTWVSLGIVLNTLPLWLDIALHIIGLVAIGLHVSRGLSTVATIAAGNDVLLGRIKRWVLIVGGAALVLLLVAQLILPVAAFEGWF